MYSLRAFGWGIGLLLVGFLYWKFNPAMFSIFPKCPFFVVTGYKCAGCGSQRALHALLHGDLHTAWLMNPMLLLSLPYVLFGLYMEYAGGKKQFPEVAHRWMGNRAIWFWLIALIAWWVLRNMFNL